MEQQAVTDAVLELREGGSKGELIQPGDDAYDEARTVYNAMIDKRPTLIVRPTGAADVIAAVNLAREKNPRTVCAAASARQARVGHGRNVHR